MMKVEKVVGPDNIAVEIIKAFDDFGIANVTYHICCFQSPDSNLISLNDSFILI